MIDIKNIFPECDADTLLVELITKRGKGNHNKGVSKVSKSLHNRRDGVGPFYGVVDSDKFKNIDKDPYIPYFNQIVIDKINDSEKLRLKKIPNKEHYLIFIHPEFEPWILAQAKLAGIELTEYYNSYKEFEKEFEKESKNYGIVRSQKIKKFINVIVEANPPEIILLKKWLLENDHG